MEQLVVVLYIFLGVLIVRVKNIDMEIDIFDVAVIAIVFSMPIIGNGESTAVMPLLIPDKKGMEYTFLNQHPLVASFKVTHVKVTNDFSELDDDDDVSVDKLIDTVKYTVAKKMQSELAKSKGIRIAKKDLGFTEYLARDKGNNILSLKGVGISIVGDKYQKTMKRLSRIFRSTKYGRFLDKIDMIHLEDNGDWDGMVMFCKSDYLKREFNIDSEYLDRYSVTLLHDGGMYKGHMIVDDRIKTDVILFGRPVKEIRYSLSQSYFQLEKNVSRKAPRMDLQSFLGIMMNNQMSTDDMLNDIVDYFDIVKSDINSPLMESDNLEVNSKLELLKLIDAPYLNNIKRMKWNGHKMSMNKNFKDMRFELTNSRVVYAAPLYNVIDGIPVLVDGDKIIIKDKHIMFPPKLFNEYKDIFGGFDFDDRFIVKELSSGTLIWRSPNTYQEIKIFHNIVEDHKVDMSAWKTIPSTLYSPQVPIISKSDIVYNRFDIGNRGKVKLKSNNISPNGIVRYSQQYIEEALSSFTAGKYLLGGTANTLMVIQNMCIINNVNVSSYIPKKILFELIVDASTQNGRSKESDEVEAYLKGILKQMISDGLNISQFMKFKVNKSMRDDAVFMAEDTVSLIRKSMIAETDRLDRKMNGVWTKNAEGKSILSTKGIVHEHIISDNVRNTLSIKAAKYAADPYIVKAVSQLKFTYKSYIDKSDGTDESLGYIRDAQTSVLSEFSMFSKDEQKLIVLQLASVIYNSTIISDSILFLGKVAHGEFSGIFPVFIDLLWDLGLAKRIDGYSLDMSSVESAFSALVGTGEKRIETKSLPRGRNTIQIYRKAHLGTTGYEFSQNIVSILIVGRDGVCTMKNGTEIQVSIETRYSKVVDGEYAIQEIKGMVPKNETTKVCNNGFTLSGCRLVV